jgi:hypothetical protein
MTPIPPTKRSSMTTPTLFVLGRRLSASGLRSTSRVFMWRRGPTAAKDYLRSGEMHKHPSRPDSVRANGQFFERTINPTCDLYLY